MSEGGWTFDVRKTEKEIQSNLLGRIITSALNNPSKIYNKIIKFFV